MAFTTSPSLLSVYDKDSIKNTMEDKKQEWGQLSQSELFRSVVPLGATDFTEKFNSSGLNKFFTSPKIRTGEGFNCHHLYRSSQGETDIPILSTENYTVLQPLGEPGRDLSDGNKNKISHLMVVPHNSKVLTFNEMLPSTPEEVSDLEQRLSVLEKAYENLKNDVPITECGSKVMEKAAKMGIENTGATIREYMCVLIATMSDELRIPSSSGPGYVLKDGQGRAVTTDKDSVFNLINTTFDDDSLQLLKVIQGPDNNSQLLSHVHAFLVTEVPEVLVANYLPVDLILDLKKEVEPVNPDEGEPPLARQFSLAEPDDGAELRRTVSVRN